MNDSETLQNSLTMILIHYMTLQKLDMGGVRKTEENARVVLNLRTKSAS